MQGQGYVSRSLLSAKLNWEDERIMQTLVSQLFSSHLPDAVLTCK